MVTFCVLVLKISIYETYIFFFITDQRYLLQLFFFKYYCNIIIIMLAEHFK